MSTLATRLFRKKYNICEVLSTFAGIKLALTQIEAVFYSKTEQAKELRSDSTKNMRENTRILMCNTTKLTFCFQF
jgi:hypothetical protein